jgi:hypothetical protein
MASAIHQSLLHGGLGCSDGSGGSGSGGSGSGDSGSSGGDSVGVGGGSGIGGGTILPSPPPPPSVIRAKVIGSVKFDGYSEVELCRSKSVHTHTQKGHHRR